MADRVVCGLAVREWGDPDEPGILLWPGLAASGAYFAPIAAALPGRALAVDPPGFGRSEPLAAFTYERLIALAAEVAAQCACQAIVGHSLGANLALAVASRQPPGLRAAVLIDGGYLDAKGLAQLGMPTGEGRAKLAEWLAANSPRFPDWEAAISGMAAMIGGAPSAALEAYLRDLLVEADGEIRDPASPDLMAELVLAVFEHDALALAAAVAVPTLLIACAQPAESRAIRERGWRQLADASPLIELHVAEAWGHNPILAHPEACSSLIAGWLAEHL